MTSRPCADVLVASIEADTLALGRGVEALAQVQAGNDVEKGIGSVGVVLDAERLGRLEDGRADVEVLAIDGGNKVRLCRVSLSATSASNRHSILTEVEELAEEVKELIVVPVVLAVSIVTRVTVAKTKDDSQEGQCGQQSA